MKRSYTSPGDRGFTAAWNTRPENPTGSLQSFSVGWRARCLGVLLMLISILAGQDLTAQVSGYSFAQTNGTFAAPTTGLIGTSGAASTSPSSIFTTGWDDSSATYTLPFTFNFDGTNYTTVTVSSNGFMVFGSALSGNGSGAAYAGTSNANGVYISGTVTNAGVAAWNMDAQIRTGSTFTANRTSGSNVLTSVSSTAGLKVGMRIDGTGITSGAIITAIGTGTVTLSINSSSTGSSATYTPRTGTYAAVLGSSPNRQFVMTFVGSRRFGGTDNVDYQYILNEGTNTVQVVYGSVVASTTSNTAQVGLRGTANTNFNSRTTTTDWTATTLGAANTDSCTFVSTVTLPASGLTFTWTPPVLPPCTTPSALASAAVFSSVTTTSLSGSFTAASPAPSKYLVVRSTSATPPTPVNGTSYAIGDTTLGTGTNVRLSANSTSFTDTGLTAGTLYYYHIFSYNDACSGAPFYSTSAYTSSQATVCATGTAVTVSNLTFDKGTISWTGAGNYVVEYGATGFTPGTGATAGAGGTIASASTTSPFTITGLSASTAYQVYVRQICPLGGYSANSSVLAFTTLCAPVTSFPSAQNFASYPPTCWTEGNNGTLSAGPVTVSTTAGDAWVADGPLNVGTTGAVRINLDATGDNDWMITPYYTIPAGMRMTYTASAHQWTSTGPPTTPWEADDFVEVLYSTDFLNWTVLRTYNNTNVPSHLGQTESIDLSSLSGQTVHFAFRGVEGGSDGGADIEFIVDNFTIEALPLVAPDCATGLTPADTATNIVRNTTLTWSAATGSPSSYDVYLGTSSTPSFVANVNTTSYTPAALAANTLYYWQVVPKNNNGDATGCVIQSFTTNSNFNYCAPTYSNGPGTTDQITNVTLGALSNASGASSSPYYTFYNAVTVPTIYRSNTATVSVTMGSHSNQFSAAWIDFNQNGTFESSEAVIGGNAGSNGTANLVFNVPATAELGNTRLRVRGGDDSALTATQACGASNSTWGETEDYIVNIAPPPAPTITSLGSASGCEGTSITINGTDLNGATASGVTIGGTPVASITSNNGSVLVAVIGAGTSGVVSVTTPGGTATSSSSFTVDLRPIITAQPLAPAAVCATAGIASISVSATGATTYQWRRNGSNLSNTAPFSGADTATLTITNPAEADAGSYDVVIGNAAGCTVTSNAVSVTVNPAPPTANSISICAGGSGALTASGTCTGFVNSGTTLSGAWASGTDAVALRPTTSIADTATCSFDAAITRNYVKTNFQVSITGSYTFEMNNSASFDGMGYIVSGAFVPGNCLGGGTWIKGDDDSGTAGDEPLLTATLTAGVTYTLVSTTYGASSGTYSGSFGWTVTPPSGGQIMLPGTVPVSWYTTASGGSPIATTNSFDPVGVSGSGITDTNTPGVTTFYAACGSNESCRTAATFTIVANTTYYQDADGDTYGNPAVTQLSCTGAPVGYVADNTDCDDNDITKHATFAFYADADNDGFGAGAPQTLCAVNASTPPSGYSVNNTDCDDTKNTVYPGATEIGYNLIDDDCDGLTDEGFPPKTTVIQGGFCNQTLASIDTQIVANIVSGAQGYRWRVTTMSGPNNGQIQTLDTALRVMKLTQLTNYAFNTQYKIELSVLFAGFWQPFTTSTCTVSTPAASTLLTSCGGTLTNLSDAVYANLVPYAAGYSFKITDPVNPINTQTLERSVRDFKMTMITNFVVQYGKTYNVEVAVKNTDGTYMSFGSACPLTTPLFPTTSLQDAQCDDYAVPNSSTLMYAFSYPGAIGYAFQLTGPGLPPAGVEVVKNVRTFSLSDFASAGLIPGATYNVKVRLIFNLSDPAGPYGKTCTIVTPGASRIVANKAVFNAVAFPNPFAENFNIDVTTSLDAEVNVKVYDMTGRLLGNTTVKPTDVSSLQIGENYPSGVYNVIVTQGDNAKTLRVIKR
ncbi:hypothetical protein FLLO111716_11120 [Flavobacterium longum]|uniref:GEVED domain-containing protein n=1 Tax=Flavobacterium longum TaxID=1299340 RepID=UPI0039E9893E